VLTVPTWRTDASNLCHLQCTPTSSRTFVQFSLSMKTINNPLTRGTVEDLSHIWVTYIIKDRTGVTIFNTKNLL